VLLINNPELLGAFRRGDKAALEVVYRHYVKGLTHFVQKGFTFRSAEKFFYFKGFRNVFDLHNAVQEVFRRAFEEKARLSYNGVSSYSNWILAIARNMIINQFRNREIPFSQFEEREGEGGRQWENQLTDEYSGVLHGTTGDNQDLAMEKAQLKELMARFMTQLSDEDKELVRLRYTEGQGQEETAKAMSSTRMRIRTQEAKVRRRLIAYLRHSGYLDQFAKSTGGLGGGEDDETKTIQLGRS
jgi:RNA polymerase sigma factor (sigma-70 family)